MCPGNDGSSPEAVGEELRSQLFATRRLGAAVARELGISRERVSQWKRGESQIPPRYHKAVEAILERRKRFLAIAAAGLGLELKELTQEEYRVLLHAMADEPRAR